MALVTTAAAVIRAAESSAPATTRGLLLWDTAAPLGENSSPDWQASWKVVPNDLMLLEADPPKARSDPGYYGREYGFQGDAVVETAALRVVFWSARGRVTVSSKPGAGERGSDGGRSDRAGDRVVEVSPLREAGAAWTISRVEVVWNADDQIVLRATFGASDAEPAVGSFSFDRTGIIEIRPEKNLERVRLASPMEYGVVPSFVGDDLVYGGGEQPFARALSLPSENLFLGLLPGERAELLVTWPTGRQRLNLLLGETRDQPLIQALDFAADAQPFYLAVLSAPGIWHKEVLTAGSLEKDVKSLWKRPFPARWKTQLVEEDLKTTFAFRESKGQIWRGVAGSFIYPVWFSGEDAFYHLSKKVPPKGQSIIYCLEGRETPQAVATPADILKQTLGRPSAEAILDYPGRKLRTHHRRGAEGIRRACTCGCTEAIQAVFEKGEEVRQQEFVQQALDDMVYFVQCHVARIDEYRQLADAVLKQLGDARQSSPALKPFLDNLEEIARQIPQECEVQKENMKTMGYADELARQTMALTSKPAPGNVKAYLDLLKAWREMGGAQDYVVAKCHSITRSLGQAAGYGCGTSPDAVPLAEAIRAQCRRALRNPDGYEIWADY